MTYLYATLLFFFCEIETLIVIHSFPNPWLMV